MPDISMCQAKNEHGNCPQKDKCYRFTATPNPWRQSFFAVAPFTMTEPQEGLPSGMWQCNYFSER